MKNINWIIVSLLLISSQLICIPGNAQQKAVTYKTESSIFYRNSSEIVDEYARSRCFLDIYHPEGQNGFATVVWFHGGNLIEGEKFIPEELKNKGIAVVAVNYRLSPRAQNPAYIEDAAAAVAWTFNNIERFGGDKDKIFISGHSAGGYLTLMVGLDPKWLSNYAISTNQIAGLFPISGQAITHTTIREEQKLDKKHRTADEFSPLYYTRNDAAPLFLITGDRNLEIPARYEENALLYAYMKSMNEKNCSLFELDGFNHVSVVSPACYLIIDQIVKLTSKAKIN
jgi:acetyl esterase/lipase